MPRHAIPEQLHGVPPALPLLLMLLLTAVAHPISDIIRTAAAPSPVDSPHKLVFPQQQAAKTK